MRSSTKQNARNSMSGYLLHHLEAYLISNKLTTSPGESITQLLSKLPDSEKLSQYIGVDNISVPLQNEVSTTCNHGLISKFTPFHISQLL